MNSPYVKFGIIACFFHSVSKRANCLFCLRAVHRAKDEKAWWHRAGIEPLKVARKLWKHTRAQLFAPANRRG